MVTRELVVEVNDTRQVLVTLTFTSDIKYFEYGEMLELGPGPKGPIPRLPGPVSSISLLLAWFWVVFWW